MGINLYIGEVLAVAENITFSREELDIIYQS